MRKNGYQRWNEIFCTEVQNVLGLFEFFEPLAIVGILKFDEFWVP